MNFLTLMLTALFLVGGTPGDDDKRDARKERTLVAQPVSVGISVDGRLDEQDWQSSPIATDFEQFEPNEGAPSSQRTEVHVLYGDNALYIGAYLYDDEPDKIQAMLGRRDAFNQADWFVVSIDSYYDLKTAYTFGLNAAGVQVDGLTTRDTDESWNAVWDGAANVTDDGWVVEMRIPYSMLRFSALDVQIWGINFTRYIPRNSELSEWSLVRRTDRQSGEVAHYGQLEGLRNLSPRRNLQISPYTASRLLTEEGPLGSTQSSRQLDFGGDLKFGISSNVTLDATINPDFGQIEADPAQLNLTAFETFFSEKRPFFLEGAQIFDFSYGREGALLYTRRIGSSAPIIGATKLSGRTEKGLSFGFLGSFTGFEFNPDRFYGIARLRQELGRYSRVGAMLTSFQYREAPATTLRSYAGGTDWDLRMWSNSYRLDGSLSFTHRIQPGFTEGPETGYAGELGFDKMRGVWTFNTAVQMFDGRFNPNDVGRLRRNDFIRFNAGFGYQVNGGNSFGPFQRASLRTFSWQNYSYEKRINQGAGLFLGSNWQTKGFQRFDLSFFSDFLFGGYDLFETRGLGAWAPPREYSLRTSFNTDSRRSWQLEPNIRFVAQEDGGRRYSTGLEGNWNAGTRLNLSAQIGYSWANQQTAWASNQSFISTEDGWAIGLDSSPPDELAEEDLVPFDDQGQLEALLAPMAPYDGQGNYYIPVFGRRDTRSVDFMLRSNITFTPTLSLQLYGQLFVARGQYNDYGILQNPHTVGAFDAYPKQHDFSLNSLQTNVVLRWEYRPGSVLYLVWSHSRNDNLSLTPLDTQSRSPFDQDTLSQLTDTFGLFPANAFMIKINYLFLR